MMLRDKKILRIGGGLGVVLGLFLWLTFPLADIYRLGNLPEHPIASKILFPLTQFNAKLERFIFGFNRSPYSGDYLVPKEIRDKHQKPRLETEKTKTRTKEEPCWLKKKSESGDEEIFNSLGCSVRITSWKGHLVFSEWKDQDTRLIALDLKSGERKVLYDFFESQADFEGAALEFTSLQVINNKLYFSIGGYAAASAIYVIESPDDISSRKLIFSNRASSSIKYDDGRFWIEGGMGDAGEGFAFRMAFDPATNAIGKEIRTAQNQVNGEIYMGSSKTEAYIAKFAHKNPENTQFLRIKEVYARNLADPENTRSIFTESAIYPGTKDVLYDFEAGKIYLLTDDVVVSSAPPFTKFIEVVRLEPGEGYWLTEPQEALCLNDTLELDIFKKQITENKEGCQRFPDSKQRMKKAMEEAQLPPSEYEYNF